MTPFRPDPCTRADTDGSLFAGWDHAAQSVRGLRGTRPSAGEPVISDDRIAEALGFCRYGHAARLTPPSTTYAFPDGAIVFEWDMHDGSLQQLEVTGPGVGELMINPLDDRPTTFVKKTWPTKMLFVGFSPLAKAGRASDFTAMLRGLSPGYRAADGPDTFALAA